MGADPTRVFLHSPSEAPDARVVATRMPELEQLGERALLLARPGDVVCLAQPVEAEYFEFLRSLSIGPRPDDVLVIHGVKPGTGLSERLGADPDAFDRLVARLAGSGAILVSPYFATPPAEALARALSARLGRPARLLGGPAALVRRLHQKRIALRLARRLGIPTAPGEVVRIASGPPSRRDLTALRAAILRKAGETGRAIVRGSSGASGSSTFVTDGPGIEASLRTIAARTDNRFYVIEPLYEAHASPNVEVVVEADAIRAAATDQLLDGALVYEGSVHPSRAARLPGILAASRTLADWMRARGFEGRAGFDFVERAGDEGPAWFLTEINPRINGASYPVALLDRLARRAEQGGVPPPAAFRTRSVPTRARDFRALAGAAGELLYDPARGEGIVPYSVAGMELGKVGIAAFAARRERAKEIFAGFASRVAFVLFLALAAIPRAAPAAAQEPGVPERPRVGVVLSGGGARGLAHVGVLEALEELRVPVDRIAGTSMGAIVGGLYASGLPADSIRGILSRVDWEEILADTPPRSALDFAHRARQRRDTVEIEIGLSRSGVSFPSGLISGQELGLLLRRVTLPVAAVDLFAGLPIPFAAVATDAATLERVVLDRGDLVEAMRASMAIPVVFAPVEVDGRLLVDGGLVDNLPVELARAMGADVVIAIDASPPLLARDELSGLFGMTEQLTRHLGRQGVERQLASADVALELELEGVGLFDFRRAEEIAARGAEATRARAAELAPFALSPAEYSAHRADRALRRPPPPAELSGVRVRGPGWLDDRLALARVDPRLFRRFDPELAERAVRRVHAVGEFVRVGYDVDGTAAPPALVLDAHGKPRGGSILLLGIDLATDSAGEAPARLAFESVASYVRTRIGARAAELRVDVRAGTTSGIEAAYRQPLDFAGDWFVEPSTVAVEVQRAVFSAETSRTEYEVRRALVGLDLGRALGLSGEARIGVRGGRETAELDPPVPGLPDRFSAVGETVGELRAALVVDRLDAVGIPRRGVYAGTFLRASREELGAPRSWTALSLDGRAYWSRGPHTLFARAAGGASSPARRLPVRDEFLLGGFGSLGGHADDELRGEAFVAGRAGWLRRVAELPPALRAVVAGGWVETGDTWDPSVDEELEPRLAGTVAVGAETLLGPVFLAWSRAEGGRGRVTVSIGRSP